MSETSSRPEKTPPPEEDGQSIPPAPQESPRQRQPWWVRQPYWVLDAEDLARRLRQITPRGDYSVQNAQNRGQRGRIIAMGGRPARAVREFSPDETYPGFFAPKKMAVFKEGGYWDEQVCWWEDFLRWKSRQGGGEAQDQAMAGEGPSPEADTYNLHVEFREYLLKSQREYNGSWFDDDGNVKPCLEEPPGGWLGDPDPSLEEFHQNMRDLDALIEDLRKEKEQGVLCEQDVQIQDSETPTSRPSAPEEEKENRPPASTPIDPRSPDVFDRVEGYEQHMPTPEDAPPSSSLSGPAGGNHDPPQANTSTERKRSHDLVDGVAGEIDPQQDGETSPRSPKRQKTLEADVDVWCAAQGAHDALPDASRGGRRSEATREPRTASGEELAEMRQSQLGEECEIAKSKTDKSVPQDKENGEGTENVQDKEGEQNARAGQTNATTRRKTGAGKVRGSLKKSKDVHDSSGLRRSERVKILVARKTVEKKAEERRRALQLQQNEEHRTTKKAGGARKMGGVKKAEGAEETSRVKAAGQAQRAGEAKKTSQAKKDGKANRAGRPRDTVKVRKTARQTKQAR